MSDHEHDLEQLLDEVRITRGGLLRSGLAAGAGAFATQAAQAAAAPPRAPRTHECWIAAVPVTWNIVPNGRNAIEGTTFAPAETVMDTVVYQAYTRGWRRRLRNLPTTSGDGGSIPGPLIRARVGDRILVHFKNLDTAFNRVHSMHFHGVHYEFASDGAYIPGFSGSGAKVAPGHTHTYELQAEPDSVGVWPYHDHLPTMMDSIRGGMYGALSILGPHERRPHREFVVYFSSHLQFMTINGRAFVGNTPVFHARVGQTVQWDVLAIGDDFHTFHIHGHRWRTPDGTPVDTRTIGPAESFRFRLREGVPGAWLYHCHVESHMAAGMIGLYRVTR